MKRNNILQKIIFLISLMPLTAFADFSIGFIPDTQNLSESNQGGQYMMDATQFFADNKDALNLKFVAHVGDMTQAYAGDATEWSRAKAATDILHNTGVLVTPAQGNHDDIPTLRQYYPTSFYQSLPYFGGVMPGAGMENAYYTFSADGMDWILVVTEFGNKAGPQNWANSVFQSHPNHRGILVTHSGLSQQNFPNEYFYIDSVVRQNDNVFLAVQGHLCANNGDEYYTVQSVGGSTQHIVRVDYQCRSQAEQASVRYYTFKPAEDRVYAYTYNAPTASYETIAARQYSFYYDMDTPNGSEFVSQSVPTSMIPGQSTDVSVTMKNTGTDTWNNSNGQTLGSQNPENNSDWGLTRVALPSDTAPGIDATFDFNITAPTQPGMYNFQWQMVDEAGVETGWFGPDSPNVLVNVGNLQDTADGGTVSDNGVNVPAGETSVNAFDNNDNTKFLTFSTSAYLEYQYSGSAQEVVTTYSVTSANDASERDPSTIVFRGSNNGSTWTTIDTQNNIVFSDRFEKKAFNFNNSTAYEYYRLEMSNSNPSNILQVAEIELLVPGNNPPLITSVAPGNVDATTNYSYTITATDYEGDNITYSAPTRPGWLNFNAATQVLSGTPAIGDIGMHPVVLRAADAGDFSEQSFNIIVSSPGNDAPVISSTPNTGVIENNAYSYTITASDADGDNLTYSVPTRPAWLNWNPATRILSGTPTPSDTGLNAVSISVNDGTVSTLQDFNISVFATPTPPNLVQNGSFEQGGTTPTSWSLGNSASGSNTTADPGSWSLRINGPSSPTTQTISVTPNTTYDIKVRIHTDNMTSGPLVFDCNDRPVVNTVVEEVQFVVNSSSVGWVEYSGTWNSQTETSLTLRMFAEASFAGTAYLDDVRVSSTILPNTAPVITSVPVTSANADLAYSYTVSGADAEESPLTFSAPTTPSWLSFNPATRVLSGTPSTGDVGNHNVILSVSDSDLSGTQNFTINVSPPANLPPTWNSNPLVKGNGQLTIPYSDSISNDASDPEGDSLTFTKISGASWLTVASNGTLSGTPNTAGLNTATVTVSDGSNSPVQVTVEITVNSDPYTIWKTTNNITSDSGDEDNDGIPNLMEFALGGDPNSADSSQEPSATENGSNIEFKFQREEASVTYTVEKSTDLSGWSDHATVNDSHGTVGNEATVPVPMAEMNGGKLFLRLRVDN